ncbi:T9SS type A sorting domain-containing protein [Flavobacterium selenitireducens]|uniref:T9SS type A sorting domain-containing protein n=1 Tax=Flavobacterium selenitireducens TaxID=2722704 RepID=UPI00168B362B|nr:T9SS type A sorting domain-containing protein [Flavobacterium selenitireducens]MBD3582738.1 T9SS type A sorting domain-containing protein [Flavobacterium selenitireducens]
MRKLVLAILAVAAGAIAKSNAQAPEITWHKCFGGSSEDFAQDICVSTDGGLVAVGFTYSTNGDISNPPVLYQDMWVVKTDPNGNLIWEKTFASDDGQYEIPESIAPTPDGGYIIAANYSEGAWIVKLNPDGEMQWDKTIAQRAASEIHPTVDGGYILTSSDFGSDSAQDIWVAKLENDGDIEWEQSIGGSGIEAQGDIRQTADGGYIFAGGSASSDGDLTLNHGGLDFWVVRLNSTGHIQWQKSFGSTGEEWATSVAIAPAGGYVVAGYTHAFGNQSNNNGDVSGFWGARDLWVIKIDDDGNLQWQKCLGGSALEDVVPDVMAEPDGTFTILGSTTSNDGNVSFNNGNDDVWMVRIDSDGSLEWEKTYGGTGFQTARCSLAKTPDDGYAFVASANQDSLMLSAGHHGSSDFWIVKIGGTLGTQDTLKNAFSIHPNPVADMLYFSDPVSHATIYAADGKRMPAQLDDLQTIDASKLEKGVYFLQVNMRNGKKQNAKFVKI